MIHAEQSDVFALTGCDSRLGSFFRRQGNVAKWGLGKIRFMVICEMSNINPVSKFGTNPSTKRTELMKKLLIIPLLFSVAHAALVEVRIDFEVAATSPTGNWNIATDASTTIDLINFDDGLDSGVDLGFSGRINTSGSNTEWNNSNAGPTWLGANTNPAQDYFWANEGSQFGASEIPTLTLTGLAINTNYRVELVASSDSTNAGDAEYAINGQFFDGSTDGAFDALTDGYNSGSWMTWSAVNSGASGELVLTADPDEFNNVVGAVRLNSMMVSIPEPSTLMLTVLAMAGGLLALRRRK
jgi:hypothetical protein